MTRRPIPTTLRIAALAMLLALASSLLLLGFIRFRMHDDALATLRGQVNEEARSLAEVGRTGGRAALARAVRDAARGDDALLLAALIGPDGRRIAGDPPPLPLGVLLATSEFRIVALPGGGEAGLVARRVGDDRLIAGRLFGEGLAFQRTLERSLGLAVLLALVLGAGCGLIVARYVGARVAAISAVVDRVGTGGLDARVPLAGNRDSFDALAVRINRMLERIGSLMGELRLLTDGLAHDLRSPVGRLRAHVERALACEDPAQREQLLAGVLPEADALARILGVALEIGRIEAAPGAHGFAWIDPAELVGELAEIYAPTLEDAGMALEVDVAAGLGALHGHRQLLAQALSNLIDNALTYAGSGGRIKLFARGDGGGVAIGVADAGPGIPANLRGEAMRRFGRLDAARSAPGAGLGLALVEAVARHHRGSIELSDAAPGLVATMRMP